jgi:hypothetical protein
MGIMMSYNAAIAKQEEQLQWYGKRCDEAELRQRIQWRTKPCPPDVDPNVDMPIVLINHLVPRGSCIEFEITQMSRRKV